MPTHVALFQMSCLILLLSPPCHQEGHAGVTDHVAKQITLRPAPCRRACQAVVVSMVPSGLHMGVFHQPRHAILTLRCVCAVPGHFAKWVMYWSPATSPNRQDSPVNVASAILQSGSPRPSRNVVILVSPLFRVSVLRGSRNGPRQVAHVSHMPVLV